MKYNDFKIGGQFYTGSGLWKVLAKDYYELDEGCQVVVAQLVELSKGWLEDVKEGYIGKTELEVDNVLLFWEYDFGGCDLEDRFSD